MRTKTTTRLTQEQAELLCETYGIAEDSDIIELDDQTPELAQACRALIKIAEGE